MELDLAFFFLNNSTGPSLALEEARTETANNRETEKLEGGDSAVRRRTFRWQAPEARSDFKVGVDA